MKEVVCINDDWTAMPGNPLDGAPKSFPLKNEIYHVIDELEVMGVQLFELEEFPSCGWDKEHFAEIPGELHGEIHNAVKEKIPAQREYERFCEFAGSSAFNLETMKRFNNRESEEDFELRKLFCPTRKELGL